MKNNFSSHLQSVLMSSGEEASRLDNGSIGIAHLLLGLIREKEGTAAKILDNLGMDLDEIKREIEDVVKSMGKKSRIEGRPLLTKRAGKILKIAYIEAEKYKSDVIGTEHLLLALVKETEEIIAQRDDVIDWDTILADEDLATESKRVVVPDDNTIAPDARSEDDLVTETERAVAKTLLNFNIAYEAIGQELDNILRRVPPNQEIIQSRVEKHAAEQLLMKQIRKLRQLMMGGR